MKTLSQLKEGDILYEYDLNKKFLNILYVIGLDYARERVAYKSLVVSDVDEYDTDSEGFGIYIWFPENYDLEQAILVHYFENTWSIFSLDYSVIEEFVTNKEIELNKRFTTALDIFDQREIQLFEYNTHVEPF